MNTKKWKGNINRAVLDASAAFSSLGKVFEEYTTNPMDRFEELIQTGEVDPSERKNLKIQIVLDRSKNRLLFIDQHEKMGMSGEVLFDQFFNIHGENQARKRHVNVRGKHGTGKSAAFGLEAKSLCVDSTFDGVRNRITSTLESLQKSTGDDGAKLDIEIEGEPVKTLNGTNIEIQLSKKYEVTPRLVESALKHVRKVFTNWLNQYNVELVEINPSGKVFPQRIRYEPKIPVDIMEFSVPTDIIKVTGPGKLIIKRAAVPLEPEDRGITITSGGYSKEITLFNLDSEQYSEYFFGEWEVPMLDKYVGSNPPSLSTRELKLNPDNEIVKEIYTFGKAKLLAEIKKFAVAERKRKQDEQTKRLTKMANELAKILNEDFETYGDLKKGKGKKKPELDPDAPGNKPGDKPGTNGPDPAPGPGPKPRPRPPTPGPTPTNKRKGSGYRPRGGFKIEFSNLNHNAFIARYERDTKIITINLDSQIVKAALKACANHLEAKPFKTICYMIAVDEYARALVNVAEANGEFHGTSQEDVLQEGLTMVNMTKKRVLDKLSSVIDLMTIHVV